MKKFAKDINELADKLKSSDASMKEILTELESIQENIKKDVNNRQKPYKLPYSSNPEPIDSKWKVA